jgi:integrase
LANGLTALKVEKLRHQGRYPDGDGLYLQIGPTGSKAWMFRYQLDGRERFMGLGSVKAFSLKEARERARRSRQLLADGLDPIEHRLASRDLDAKVARERITFKEATEQFLAVHEAGWRNAKHRAQWRSTLKAHAFPILGERPITAIDQALINSAVSSIWTLTPETARRVRDRIERICQWVRAGMPLPTRNGKAKRSHAALPWQDIPSFMAELSQRHSVSARALEFTILTAARTGEVIGATWSEIDLGKKVWNIPAERMKSQRPHRVPLSAPVIELLKALPTEKGNPFVFIGGREGQPLSNMAMLELLKGMKDGLTVHGFRSCFKDWAAEATSTPNMVSEAALAHVVADKTEAAYRRGDLFAKRRVLMADWAAYVTTPLVETGKVLPMSAVAR